MDIGKEDSDEAKIAAVGAVVAIGEQVYVKVVEVKEDDGSGRYGSYSVSQLWLMCQSTHLLSLLYAYSIQL